MSVTSATTSLPIPRPMPTSVRASAVASGSRFMKAPLPTLTSSTRPSIPSASFFDMIEAAMRGIDSTVAVRSRSAYSLRSAGAMRSVCPTRQAPTEDTSSRNLSTGRWMRKPGIDSSLSRVPPVWPSPRPLTMGTLTPQAATSGASASEVLSPTPPVECLSIFGPGMSERSSTSPEWSMAPVRACSSGSLMPRKKTAMQKAAIW